MDGVFGLRPIRIQDVAIDFEGNGMQRGRIKNWKCIQVLAEKARAEILAERWAALVASNPVIQDRRINTHDNEVEKNTNDLEGESS